MWWFTMGKDKYCNIWWVYTAIALLSDRRYLLRMQCLDLGRWILSLLQELNTHITCCSKTTKHADFDWKWLWEYYSVRYRPVKWICMHVYVYIKKSCKGLSRASVVLERAVIVLVGAVQTISFFIWCRKKKTEQKKKHPPQSLYEVFEKITFIVFSCWFKFLFFFFLYISEKVWFNLQSANCSHSLCTTTLPPGIPVLQSLETSFLRWACAGRFIWAWNCTHHRNIESNQARLKQKDIWTGWNWIF